MKMSDWKMKIKFFIFLKFILDKQRKMWYIDNGFKRYGGIKNEIF